MDKNVAQGDKEQGERCPRPELGTANGINVTDQLPPGVEANHIYLTDDDAAFAPKIKIAAQGEIERPPPQGEQHLRPGRDTANDTIATEVGKLIAQRGSAQKISQVVFDRGGFKYHGKVKALADAARDGGFQF